MRIDTFVCLLIKPDKRRKIINGLVRLTGAGEKKEEGEGIRAAASRGDPSVREKKAGMERTIMWALLFAFLMPSA